VAARLISSVKTSGTAVVLHHFGWGNGMTDTANAQFWDEPCGSTAFQQHGFSTVSEFDRWYFNFYPFLDRYLDPQKFAGKRILEVGLGYGSIGQRLAAVGDYTGLDIADGPVDLMRSRGAHAQRGSVLDLPFAAGSFDAVVSIGCIHHTGDMRRAISEIGRVTKPGGHTLLMVYNAANYVEWIKRPVPTARYCLRSLLGSSDARCMESDERHTYDSNSEGTEAPETVLVTRAILRRMMAPHFHDITLRLQNCFGHKILPRDWSTRLLERHFGINIYAEAVKS
jgi:SAM-dependent methyltransferase